MPPKQSAKRFTCKDIEQAIQPAVRYELDRSWKRDILKKLHLRVEPVAVREVRSRGKSHFAFPFRWPSIGACLLLGVVIAD